MLDQADGIVESAVYPDHDEGNSWATAETGCQDVSLTRLALWFA